MTLMNCSIQNIANSIYHRHVRWIPSSSLWCDPVSNFFAVRHRKLLNGDLLLDRDFTLPELDGVAGVELVPGAVRVKGPGTRIARNVHFILNVHRIFEGNRCVDQMWRVKSSNRGVKGGEEREKKNKNTSKQHKKHVCVAAINTKAYSCYDYE